MRELIPTARIARAGGPALPRAERDLSGVAFPGDGRDWTIGEFLAASHTDGFLVLHRGQVVAEHYGHGMTPATPHLLMSVSKSAVSAVAGILMGAESDAELTLDPHGNPMADGGLCATLRDLGRFGWLFAADGGGIVPAAWIEDTVRGAPDGPAAFAGRDNPPGFPAGAHCRNCWWVRDPAAPFFHASGINGQRVFFHPPSQTVVVKLSCWPEPLSQPLLQLTVRAAQAVAAHLGGAW